MSESPRVTPPPKGCELLRENVFEDKDSYSDDEGEMLKRREPTMMRRGKKLIAPSATDSQKKFTVVFDLDETVVYARDGPLYARAYLKDLLRSIKDDFEVIVWTAGERDYAKTVLEEINEDHIIEHLVYRHHKWFNEQDYTKDLKQLGRDLDYTIIVENTPDCVRVNPENGIIVEDFEVLPESSDDDVVPAASQVENSERTPRVDLASGGTPTTTTTAAGAAEIGDGSSLNNTTATMEAEEPCVTPSPKAKRKRTDRTLYLLREVLLSLAASGETVPAFLATCPLLSRQTVMGSDGNDIRIYHLGTRRRRRDAGVMKKIVKENRDKAVAPAGDGEEQQQQQQQTSCQPLKGHSTTADGNAVAAVEAVTPAKRARSKASEEPSTGVKIAKTEAASSSPSRATV